MAGFLLGSKIAKPKFERVHPMPQATTKAKIVRAVEELPDNATIEDAIDRLVFLHKIELGLKQSQDGKTVSLDEVEARLKRRRRSKQTE